MAVSPAHRFGQIIGDVLEAAFEPLLRDFAAMHNLYLDKKGVRAARTGMKVSWTDSFGNKHDLDFVLERNGAPDSLGTPVAFIEVAWRRYTKHSRNKAQEIQGAIMPLVVAHQNAAPFFGAILGGVFTEGALSQLKSLGFRVLYAPFDHILAVFQSVGINAFFDESTSDIDFAYKVSQWDSLPLPEREAVGRELVRLTNQQIAEFMRLLERSIARKIESVRVLPLHGAPFVWNSIEDAITFIDQYDEACDAMPVIRYEVIIKYDSGEHVDGYFSDRESTGESLRTYQPPSFRPSIE